MFSLFLYIVPIIRRAATLGGRKWRVALLGAISGGIVDAAVKRLVVQLEVAGWGVDGFGWLRQCGVDNGSVALFAWSRRAQDADSEEGGAEGDEEGEEGG